MFASVGSKLRKFVVPPQQKVSQLGAKIDLVRIRPRDYQSVAQQWPAFSGREFERNAWSVAYAMSAILQVERLAFYPSAKRGSKISPIWSYLEGIAIEADFEFVAKLAGKLLFEIAENFLKQTVELSAFWPSVERSMFNCKAERRVIASKQRVYISRPFFVRTTSDIINRLTNGMLKLGKDFYTAPARRIITHVH